MKFINSLRFTSLFSKDLSVIFMVSKSCVKYASMLNCKFFGSEFCSETV